MFIVSLFLIICYTDMARSEELVLRPSLWSWIKQTVAVVGTVVVIFAAFSNTLT